MHKSTEHIEITLAMSTPNETAQLAATIAELVPPGTTIALVGTLGSGKTFFAQSFASALGVPAESVVSPTFVICKQYETPRFRLNHLDVYRLLSVDDFFEIGTEEMMESDSVQLIEWADRFEDYLPDQRLDVELSVTGERTREVRLEAWGVELVKLVRACAI